MANLRVATGAHEWGMEGAHERALKEIVRLQELLLTPQRQLASGQQAGASGQQAGAALRAQSTLAQGLDNTLGVVAPASSRLERRASLCAPPA